MDRRPIAAFSMILAASTLSGCNNIFDTYRSINDQRRAYPIVEQASASDRRGYVDLPVLLDPYGLGPGRIAAVRSRDKAPPATTPGGEPFDPSDPVAVATFGFYDPRSLSLSCGRLGGDLGRPDETLPAAEAAAYCATNDKAKPAPGRKRYVDTRTVRTTTVTRTTVFADKTPREQLLVRRYTDDSTTREETPRPVPPVEAFQRERRDRIQDQLLAASEANCSKFKSDNFLLRADAGFGLGVGALAATGAGAVFTGASPMLAALGAGLIGTDSALEQSYYGDKTIPVINKAIDAGRKTVLGEIYKKRERSIKDYTVEAAIGDAVAFHNACTIQAGFEETDRTLTERLGALQESIDERLEPVREAQAAREQQEAQGAPSGSGSGAGGGLEEPAPNRAPARAGPALQSVR